MLRDWLCVDDCDNTAVSVLEIDLVIVELPVVLGVRDELGLKVVVEDRVRLCVCVLVRVGVREELAEGLVLLLRV